MKKLIEDGENVIKFTFKATVYMTESVTRIAIIT